VIHVPLRPDDRRVRHLRLIAPDESLARRGVTLLEDALRTASIAGDGGSRLLYFRRISAGRIRPGQSATELSTYLEQQFRDAAAGAVHGGSSEAGRAAAVWFSNPVEPCCIAAERIALGHVLDAWFWRLAVPEALQPQSRVDLLIALSTRLAATEPGPAAIVSLIDHLARRGLLEKFLADLTPRAATQLVDLLGLPRPVLAPSPTTLTSPTRVHHIASTAPTWQALLRTWIVRWGAADIRSVWLAAVSLATTNAAQRFDAALVESAAQLAHVLAISTEPPPDPIAPAIASVSPILKRDSLVPSTTHSPEAIHGTHVLRPRESTPPLTVDVSGPAPAPAPVIESSPYVLRQPAYRAFTHNAGLYFLLPAMARLDLPRHVATSPHLPDRVLLCVARHLRLDPDDPILAPLEDPPNAPDDAAPWVRALRIFCVRRARIAVRSLVHRTGYITTSPTHIDIALPLARADARIRKAGLDFDPGWLPWFGRVVRFHYESGL
jgi:hypothetical protein